MAAIMKTQVIVNGITISNDRLINWEINETFGQEIGSAKIICTNGIYSDIPDLNSGMSITIKRGTKTATDQYVFSGEIVSITKNGEEITLECNDKMIDLVKATVTYSFNGSSFPSTEAKGSDIATSLIETWGGMSANVVDTGSVLTLNKFICNGTDVFSRLQVLAEIYDYQIYYDTDIDKINFEPKGYVGNTASLIVGGIGGNVANLPKWTFDNRQCVNKLIIKGAVQEVQDRETFSGTGAGTASQVFTLAKKPINVWVWEETDGAGTYVLKTPGVENSTSGTYDYTIDKESKTITTDDGWNPGATANNVRVDYTNAIPVPVQVEDVNSQAKYGIFVAEKMFSDIQSVADAETRGNAWIAQYAEPFVKTMVKPATLNDFDVGQLVGVTDNINNESRSLVINKIKKKYPHNGDELSLGDKDFKLADWGSFTLERIRRLEEENQKNTDLIIQIHQFPHTVSINRRYLEAQRIAILGDGFVLGNSIRAILGTSKLGTPYLDTMVWDNINYAIWGTNSWGSTGTSTDIIRLVWPSDTYVETFMDDDFESSGTATWDTTNKKLIFN